MTGHGDERQIPLPHGLGNRRAANLRHRAINDRCVLVTNDKRIGSRARLRQQTRQRCAKLLSGGKHAIGAQPRRRTAKPNAAQHRRHFFNRHPVGKAIHNRTIRRPVNRIRRRPLHLLRPQPPCNRTFPATRRPHDQSDAPRLLIERQRNVPGLFAHRTVGQIKHPAHLLHTRRFADF